MMVDHYSRVYARQEYLTPGEPETVAFIAEAIRADSSSLVLEVASGKGEAACVLAEQTDCRILGVDRHPPFLAHAQHKITSRGLGDRVGLLRADGARLPLAAGRFDAAYCIGAPSIVGLERCLQELHRTVRPAGPVIVSDIVWRVKPDEPLGPEWGWFAEPQQRLSADEYARVLHDSGLTVQSIHIHSVAAWDAYHQPMRTVAADERARGDEAFASEVERDIDVERRGADAFVDYATFITRNAAQ
jgi:ubiquinone/menaquinone biosynthesis C-methylase UbiE